MEQKTLVWFGTIDAVLRAAMEEDKNVIYVGSTYVEWDAYTSRRGPVIKNTFGFNMAEREMIKQRIEEGTLLASIHVGYTECNSIEEYDRVTEKDEREAIETLKAVGDMYKNGKAKNGMYFIVDVGEFGGFQRSEELQKVLVDTPNDIQMILLTDRLETFDDERWWSRDMAYGVEGEA